MYERCPMNKNYMVIKQRVADLARFQAAFDELKPKREAHGLHDIGQFRSADEPNTIIVLLEVADVERARPLERLERVHRRFRWAGAQTGRRSARSNRATTGG